MQISFNPAIYNTRSLAQKNTTSLAANNVLKADTVSFGAKRSNNTSYPRVKTALNYSQDILNTAYFRPISLNDIKAITQKYSSDVDILPMSELSKRKPNASFYGAFMSTFMNEEFVPGTKEMFIAPLSPRADKMEKVLYAMNCAHEFTHMLQVDEGYAFKMLKDVSGGNYEYGKLVMSVGDAIFAYFDNYIQAQAVGGVIAKTVNPYEMNKYHMITPKEMFFSRQMLPASFGLANEKEFREFLNTAFNQFYKQIENDMTSGKTDFMRYIPDNESLSAFKQKVKEYCALKAKDEAEAYTTESEIAKKFLNTRKSINLDAFPAYYEVVANALN